MDEARRRELEGYIAATRANQRKLGIGVAIAGALTLVLAIARVPFALLGVFVVAIVAVCGFWVTSAHIADWRRKLDDRGPAQPVGGRLPREK
jgi:hypothetical protein